jgi:chitodextrinase
MITIEKAKALRKKIESMSAELTDTDALDVPELFPKWSIKEYAVGDRVRYEDVLYKCLQAHTAQSDWTPDVAVSMWVRVDDPSIEFPEWIQPTGAQDAYMKGDKVSYNGKHYISIVDNNVWSPTTYGWDEV